MQTRRYDRIDSTNDEARRLLVAGRLPNDTCIVARAQTHGRGTHERTWHSPHDAGIYLTVVRHISPPLQIDPRRLTPALGAACAAVLQRASGAPVTLRGVNDLYAADRKLGGLLTEALASGSNVTAILVGLGVNVRAGAVVLPDHDPVQPIALEELTPGKRWSPPDVAGLADDLATTLATCLDRTLRS